MKIAEFRPKHVPGLYLFAHFEHPSGAFIQAHLGGGLYVYQAADGTRRDFSDYETLRAHVEDPD